MERKYWRNNLFQIDNIINYFIIDLKAFFMPIARLLKLAFYMDTLNNFHGFTFVGSCTHFSILKMVTHLSHNSYSLVKFVSRKQEIVYDEDNV